MADSPFPILSPRFAARPRCLVCQSGTQVQRVTKGRAGYEHWTLRCDRCGHIDQVQVSADPMKSEAMGWLGGGLKPPA